MTDWSALSDAYGAADTIPELLDRAENDPDDEVWGELWSRLCHQGTVYSASFAALPALEGIARAAPPEDRLNALALAGAIVASEDRSDVEGEPLQTHAETVARLHALSLESLSAPGRTWNEFVYLLEAARALGGDRIWGRRLEHLADGEFPAECSGCGSELYLVIGTYGVFVASEEWMKRPQVTRMPIKPGAEPLREPGRWLRERAQAVGQDQVAEWIGFIFGTSRCPACEVAFSVAEAIARFGE